MRRNILARTTLLSLLTITACAGAQRESTASDPRPAAATEKHEVGNVAAGLYAAHCAACHGEGRLGGMGPALLPENLARLRKGEAARVIAGGRPATQMPAFADRLNEDEIELLSGYIYEAPAEQPVWGAAEILNSRIEYPGSEYLRNKPVFEADPENLFIVVEVGDHHATVLDGDTFTPIHRFQTRFALHGGPKFSPDGRYVYFASRDGWVSKFDLWNLKVVAEIRAGINTRNVAVSADGRWVLVGNYLPHNVVLLDVEKFTLKRVIPTIGADGASSRVSAVYQAAPRDSFIVALKDAPELWEIKVSAADMKNKWVHDHRKESGDMLAVSERIDLRRIVVDGFLDEFLFDPDYRYVVGSARGGEKGQVIDLDKGEVIASVDIPGMPHLASGITWEHDGRTIIATPNLKDGLVSIIDMASWKLVKQIPTQGPGFFMRSHEKSPYAWVDVFFGPNKDKVHVIDKNTLEIVKTLQPAPGKTAAHVEFTKDGRYALLSIWDMDGAVVVYDAQTLEEVKRIPMVKPSGKYNVHNKVTLSRGTSH